MLLPVTAGWNMFIWKHLMLLTSRSPINSIKVATLPNSALSCIRAKEEIHRIGVCCLRLILSFCSTMNMSILTLSIWISTEIFPTNNALVDLYLWSLETRWELWIKLLVQFPATASLLDEWTRTHALCRVEERLYPPREVSTDIRFAAIQLQLLYVLNQI